MSIPINSVSVKVMRSHDYCHFEVVLTHQAQGINYPGFTAVEVDDLRKTAARLADKAVEQYKIAKDNAQQIIYDERKLSSLNDEAREIEQKPESERTPQEQAKLKAIKDLRFSRHRYDYEDDFQEEPEWEPEIPETDDAVF